MIAFQCGYDLGLNNSSLAQDKIRTEYCNNQILKTENVKEDLTTLGFGSILIVIALIITGTSEIWLIVRSSRRRRERREEASSGVSLEKKVMINNNRQEDGGGEEQDYRFTPKKVLFYCITVGLVSGILSIFFIDWLGLLFMAAFVFASITVWYMFDEKFHRWKEIREKKRISE